MLYEALFDSLLTASIRNNGTGFVFGITAFQFTKIHTEQKTGELDLCLRLSQATNDCQPKYRDKQATLDPIDSETHPLPQQIEDSKKKDVIPLLCRDNDSYEHIIT